MNITLFNRNYWIRRFGEQKEVKGHLVSTYQDFVASLHVHPAGTEAIMELPEGERKIRRLEGHGTSPKLLAASHDDNRKGDLLYYKGEWYECVSSNDYDHTLLAHYNYQFTLIPKDSAGTTDLAPPKTSPDDYSVAHKG